MLNDIQFEIVAEGVNIRPPSGALGFSTSVLLCDGAKHILFDTGSFGVRNKIKELLSNGRITHLVLSHLHFDHCANIDLFENVPIYVSEQELDSLGKNDDINTYDILRHIVNRLDFHLLTDKMFVSPNVQAIRTSGHTAGHFSLAFQSGGQRIIAAGDAVKSALEYNSGKLIVTPFDMSEHKKTLSFIKQNFDIIIPGHQAPFAVSEPTDNEIELTRF